MAKTAWEANIEDNKVSTEGPGQHQYKGGGSMVKGIQRVWFGGKGKRGFIFGFLP